MYAPGLTMDTTGLGVIQAKKENPKTSSSLATSIMDIHGTEVLIDTTFFMLESKSKSRTFILIDCPELAGFMASANELWLVAKAILRNNSEEYFSLFDGQSLQSSCWNQSRKVELSFSLIVHIDDARK
jgi:hypothetical protein